MRTSTLLRMEMVPVLRRLPTYSKLAWALIREPHIRRRHKALLVGGVGYLLSPLDLIPGIIPILGQVDDLAVVLWALRATLRAAPPEVAERHLADAGVSWEDLDEDLRRVGRTGRLVTRAAFGAGQRLAAGAGRTIRRLGKQVLSR